MDFPASPALMPKHLESLAVQRSSRQAETAPRQQSDTVDLDSARTMKQVVLGYYTSEHLNANRQTVSIERVGTIISSSADRITARELEDHCNLERGSIASYVIFPASKGKAEILLRGKDGRNFRPDNIIIKSGALADALNKQRNAALAT